MAWRSPPAWRAATTLLLTFTACTPTLDWRESHPAGSGVHALFPCRPVAQSREVALGAASLRMTIHACRAGDALYALGHADVDDPARVGAALVALRDAAARNLHADAPPMQALAIPGMTPHAQAGHVRLVGQRPDGTPVREELALFARGTTVYQATVLGETLDAHAVQTFLSEMRLAP